MYSLAIYKGKTIIEERELVGQNAFSIGRNRQNDIYLPDLTSSVSRYHVGIYCDSDGNYFLQDLGSRNGTYVDGKRRDYGRLIEGEQIEIGLYILKFQSKSDVSDRKKPSLVLVNTNFNDARETIYSPIIIENNEYDIIKSNAEMVQILYQMNHVYNSTLDLDRTLIYIIDQLRSLFRPERLLIGLLENDGERLVHLASCPVTDGEVQFSRTILRQVLKEQKIIATENASEDPRFKQSSKTAKSILALKIKSAVCIPLFVDGKIKAILFMDGYETKQLERKENKCFLSLIGTELSFILERNLQSKREIQENIRLQNKLLTTNSLVGVSVKSRELNKEIEKYANVFRAALLLLGETGTGKNLVAGLLHQQSNRNKNPFIEVNCAAIPPDLIESELFGHKKGAFTGAYKDRPGKFKLAHNGTLFLNEIGELPLHLQPKLLDAIAEKRIWPVGADEPVDVDIRVITATNRDLAKEVRNGKFRQDLYERLNNITIQLSPLRERKEDIMILAGFFLYQLRQDYNKPINRFSIECVDFLQSYDWPGNVRQLRHAIERAVINTETTLITPNQFGININDDIPVSLRDIEKAHIIRVLEFTVGNKEKACKILGITKQTLYNKGKEYGLDGFSDNDQTV